MLALRMRQSLSLEQEERVSHVLDMLTRFCIRGGDDDDTIAVRGRHERSAVRGTPEPAHQALLQQAGLVRWPASWQCT